MVVDGRDHEGLVGTGMAMPLGSGIALEDDPAAREAYLLDLARSVSQTGSREGLWELAEAYYPDLLRTATWRMRGEEAQLRRSPEDVVHDAVVSVFDTFANCEEKQEPYPVPLIQYFRLRVGSLIIDARRSGYLRFVALSATRSDEAHATGTDVGDIGTPLFMDSDTQVMSTEIAVLARQEAELAGAALATVLAALTPNQRKIVVALRDSGWAGAIGGPTLGEVAKNLGTTEAAVKMALQRVKGAAQRVRQARPILFAEP